MVELEVPGSVGGGGGGDLVSDPIEVRTNYDVNVEFYGIVKIYNPVREKFLREAAGLGDEDVDPNDAANANTSSTDGASDAESVTRGRISRVDSTYYFQIKTPNQKKTAISTGEIKMKRPDISRGTMKNFFLHHSEKLVLGVSAVLLGLFFWMGFQSKPFSDQSPDQLSKLADAADSHIRSEAAWNKIKEYRLGDDEVGKRIKDAEGSVRPENFKIDPFTGIAAMTLAPRNRPGYFTGYGAAC